MREEQGRGPRTLSQEIYHIRSAATVEALTFGHPEVDVEHLLLGLMIVDGPSAEALTRAGIDLAAIRSAIADVQARDVGELGIDLAPPPRSALRASGRIGNDLPLNDRARHLIETSSYRGDDREFLRVLLDDDSKRVQRLIDHLGVDVGDLRDSTERAPLPISTPSPPDCAQPTAAIPGVAPAGSVWLQASFTQDLSVPVNRVWPVISDLSRRPEWDPSCSAVGTDDHGRGLLTRPGGDVVTQTLIEDVTEREITWRHVSSTGAPEIFQIVVTPIDGGTRLQLRRHWTVRGRVWRMLGAALAGMVRTQLRVQAQGIGQAAA